MPVSSNLSFSVSVSTNIATINAINYTPTNQVEYQVIYPDNTTITQPNPTFGPLGNGVYQAIVTEIDTTDGASISIASQFTIAYTAATSGTSFTLNSSPAFAQAVYNPMRVQMTKSPYRIGDIFFVEVWIIRNKDVWNESKPKTLPILLQTLKANGKGNGECSIDISNVLASQFRQDSYTVPNPGLQFQKDESGYIGYFIKAGYITYNRANTEVKTYEYESGVQYALRAALPLSTDGDMIEYVYNFDGEPVKYLTNLPDGVRRKRDEDCYLSFFLPVNKRSGAFTGTPFITIKADIHFSSGPAETGYELGTYDVTTGGTFLLNAKPQLLLAHPNYASITSYSIYLTYTSDYEVPFTLSKEITVDSPIQQPIPAQFMNRLGGWDAIQLRKENEVEIKTKINSFTPYLSSRVYQVDSTTSTTYHSNWLTAAEYSWLKDMMVSPAVYINNRYVSLKDESFKLDSMLGLFALDIIVAPDNEENTIKL